MALFDKVSGEYNMQNMEFVGSRGPSLNSQNVLASQDKDKD